MLMAECDTKSLGSAEDILKFGNDRRKTKLFQGQT